MREEGNAATGHGLPCRGSVAPQGVRQGRHGRHIDPACRVRPRPPQPLAGRVRPAQCAAARGGGRAPRALACEKVSVSLSMRVVVTTVSGESRQKPSAARISRTAPTQPGIAAARRRGCDYGGRGR